MPPTNSDINRLPSLEEFRAFVVDLSPNSRLLPSVSNSRVEGLGNGKKTVETIRLIGVMQLKPEGPKRDLPESEDFTDFFVF